MTPTPSYPLIRLRTPSRLHFGLLAWNRDAPRQFGGVGLMIDAPGLELTARPATSWQAEGPLAGRALQAAERIVAKLARTGQAPGPLHLHILQAAPEHAGLGTGTQLGLALACVLAELSGRPDLPAPALAELADRGRRSGVGLHGFALGGLIVDGGRRAGGEGGVPPLLARLTFPEDWSILVVVPPAQAGLHGPTEVQAFAQLPPFPDVLTDRLCRLVLLGVLPAAAERDLASFGTALTELQALVGQGFAPAQGGVYAHPHLEPIVAHLRAEGLHGVGQSSWGPTLYGFARESQEWRDALLARLRDRFNLPTESAFWTTASPTGAILTREQAS